MWMVATNGILPGGFLYVLDQQQHMCKSLFVCLKHILLCPMDDDLVPPSDMFVN
jgi:hypothetical protein